MDFIKEDDQLEETDNLGVLSDLSEIERDYEIIGLTNLDINKLKNGDYPYGHVKNIIKGGLGEYYTRQQFQERYSTEFDKVMVKPEQEDGLPLWLGFVGLHGKKPDAVLPSESTYDQQQGWHEAVIDAKAWRNFNKKSLDKVAAKYADLPILRPGGRVVFVIPDDTYQNNQSVLKAFEAQQQGDKRIEVWKMGVTNAQLEQEARELYQRIQQC